MVWPAEQFEIADHKLFVFHGRAQQHKVSFTQSDTNTQNIPPMNGRPAIECDKSIGTVAERWPHSAVLSPVHTAPKRCEPAKNERDNTNGRTALFDRL